MAENGIELSKAANIKLHLDDIKELLAQGYKLPQIVVWFKDKNIEINLTTLRSCLFREKVTAKSVKLSHEKVLPAKGAIIKQTKPVKDKTISSNSAGDVEALPVINNKGDFKKLADSIEIDFEMSPEKLAEAKRILESNK